MNNAFSQFGLNCSKMPHFGKKSVLSLIVVMVILNTSCAATVSNPTPSPAPKAQESATPMSEETVSPIPLTTAPIPQESATPTSATSETPKPYVDESDPVAFIMNTKGNDETDFIPKGYEDSFKGLSSDPVDYPMMILQSNQTRQYIQEMKDGNASFIILPPRILVVLFRQEDHSFKPIVVTDKAIVNANDNYLPGDDPCGVNSFEQDKSIILRFWYKYYVVDDFTGGLIPETADPNSPMWIQDDYTFSYMNDGYYLTKVEIRKNGKDKRAMVEITYDLLAGNMKTVSYQWQSSIDYTTQTQTTDRGKKDLVNIMDFDAKTVSDQVY